MTTDTPKRVYLVYRTDGSDEKLVDATNKFAAHRFVTYTAWGVRLATQADIVRVLPKQGEPLNAGADGATQDLFEPGATAQSTLPLAAESVR